MEWINLKDQIPPHMKEIRVWIESRFFNGEYPEKAVYLHFKGMDEGQFLHSEEQQSIHNVTKWKLA